MVDDDDVYTPVSLFQANSVLMSGKTIISVSVLITGGAIKKYFMSKVRFCKKHEEEKSFRGRKSFSPTN